MPHILKKALKLVFADDPVAPLRKLSKKDRPLKTLTERELIELESQIGREVFGPAPQDVVRREFFNLDESTWIWHEEIKQADGSTQETTTRYEVQPQGILKVQSGPRYTYLEGAELQNFVLATKEYYERVTRQLYKRDPKTGTSF
ncbi:hypothetical protein B7Z17_05240 [Candidatus Saccharibacteria bacterium 32-49-10]|nr:MAG: hypothetical protein B7Z17_05240 [Candidatus Saccharibacteria bacterium 32-49-10]